MKIVDQLYHCQMPGQVSGNWQLRCHLRIFQLTSKVQIVMMTDASFETDMNFDMDWFIPFLIDKLINNVVSEFHLEPTKLVWLEHYHPTYKELPYTNFSQVTFDWHNGQATNPQWSAIAPETVQAFILEALVSA